MMFLQMRSLGRKNIAQDISDCVLLSRFMGSNYKTPLTPSSSCIFKTTLEYRALYNDGSSNEILWKKEYRTRYEFIRLCLIESVHEQ